MEIDSQNWFDEEVEIDDVTVKEFDNFTKQYAEQKQICEEIDKQLKGQKKILDQMSWKIQKLMKKTGKSKYVNDYGTFYTQTRFTVTTPKGPEDKSALFQFLQDQGIYDQYATVNSRSLQSLYKSFLESEGPEFKMPGCDEPKYIEELRFRRK